MSPARILIVEDEPFTALEERSIMRGLGYDVVGIASFGDEAVKSAEENRPDLILMDIKLAGEMTGKEAAYKIKEREDIPVVFVSALEDQTILDEGYVCVTKPFVPETLSKAVEDVLEQSEKKRAQK